MKEVLRFQMKGKLSPRGIEPINIFKRVGKVAFELEFQTVLTVVHPVFHIFLLKMCVGERASIVPVNPW